MSSLATSPARDEAKSSSAPLTKNNGVRRGLKRGKHAETKTRKRRKEDGKGPRLTPPVEKLPQNVTRTRGNTIRRYGVKIRFKGFPLRIGSRYCTPEDASLVASIFRSVAIIDPEGNIKFSQKLRQTCQDRKVSMYLPFTLTPIKVSVEKFLEDWLKEWKLKRQERGVAPQKVKLGGNGPGKKTTLKKAEVAITVKRGVVKDEKEVGAKSPDQFSFADDKATPSEEPGLFQVGDEEFLNEPMPLFGQDQMLTDMILNGEVDGSHWTETGKAADQSWGHLAKDTLGDAQNATTAPAPQADSEPPSRRRAEADPMVGYIQGLLYHGMMVEPVPGATAQQQGCMTNVREVNDSVYFTLRIPGQLTRRGREYREKIHARHTHYLAKSSSGSSNGSDHDDEPDMTSSSNEGSVYEDADRDTAPGRVQLNALTPSVLKKGGEPCQALLVHGKLPPKAKVLVVGQGEKRMTRSYDLLCSDTPSRCGYFAINLNDFVVGTYLVRLWVDGDTVGSSSCELTILKDDISTSASVTNNHRKVAPVGEGRGGAGTTDSVEGESQAGRSDGPTQDDDTDHFFHGGDDVFLSMKAREEVCADIARMGGGGCSDLDLDLDVEDDEKPAEVVLNLGHFKADKVNLMYFGIALYIFFLAVFGPLWYRTVSKTQGSDKYLQKSFRGIENLGILETSRTVCRWVTGNAERCATGVKAISYGGMLSPANVYPVVRDPIVHGSKFLPRLLQWAPLLYFPCVMAHYPENRKNRDSFAWKLIGGIAVLESLMVFAAGYHMVFALPSLLVCALVLAFDWYTNAVLTKAEYVSNRTRYILRFSAVLCLLTLPFREYLAFAYGGLGASTGAYSYATLGFSPPSQQVFTQWFPFIVGGSKPGRGLSILKSYAYLLLMTTVISSITALVTTHDVVTVFQLVPYYLAPNLFIVTFALLVRQSYIFNVMQQLEARGDYLCWPESYL